MEILITILVLVLALVISAFVGGLLLWFAGKITGTDPYYLGMVMVAGATALTSLVFELLAVFTGAGWLEFVGTIASVIVLFALIKKYTLAHIFPDIVIMVAVYKLFTFLLGMVIAFAHV
ncbi:MAG: hypothetical protein Q7Q73_00590 [Verrucomicrobiota bacterium JB024]|nr:hypothetical protein [Verrucomicrobiota bacterium JB024]